MEKPANVDVYIQQFSPEIQKILEEIRETIKSVVPEAKEIISYGMPAYKVKHVLVYFAAYKKHIGFYPAGSGIEAFKNEFAPYKWSKGAVQFPVDQPMPLELIARITKFKAETDAGKTVSK